jgi:hypothetical protein
VIDVINAVGKYQKVYCSDIFSSIELIPLETRDECFLSINLDIVLNDSIIVVSYIGGSFSGMITPGNSRLYAFDVIRQF